MEHEYVYIINLIDSDILESIIFSGVSSYIVICKHALNWGYMEGFKRQFAPQRTAEPIKFCATSFAWRKFVENRPV